MSGHAKGRDDGLGDVLAEDWGGGVAVDVLGHIGHHVHRAVGPRRRSAGFFFGVGR